MLTEKQAELLALLFTAGEPLAVEKISDIMHSSTEELVVLLAESESTWRQLQLPFVVEQVAGGWQLCLSSQYQDLACQLRERIENRLSAASLETLAIIALRQPVTRIDIEMVRGVKSERILSNLCERGLIEEVGRKDTPGRPILYSTTKEFLLCFGLNSLQDMPQLPIPEVTIDDSNG